MHYSSNHVYFKYVLCILHPLLNMDGWSVLQYTHVVHKFVQLCADFIWCLAVVFLF
jgi:hypothetical protein